MAALLAGLPVEVPGVTVNRLCASGLEAINQASRALRLGGGDLYLAGGGESMSRAPWVLPKPESSLERGPQTLHDTALGWRLVNPLMAEMYSTEAMGETAENVAERYASHARTRTPSPCEATSGRSPRQPTGASRRDRPDRRPAARRAGRGVQVAADEGPRPTPRSSASRR